MAFLVCSSILEVSKAGSLRLTSPEICPSSCSLALSPSQAHMPSFPFERSEILALRPIYYICSGVITR